MYKCDQKSKLTCTFEVWTAVSRGLCQYILSASNDGKIKSWRYDKNEPEHEFEGPICSSVSIAATTDSSRLFSCGTIKDGTGSSFLVEWNEPHEGIIRCYSGLSTHTDGALQFDMANDHILAIGDDLMVKFWNVDKSESLCFVDADGRLLTFPRIRFNKSGSLLAVSANDNFTKILASKSGQEMLAPSHLPSTAQTSSHMDDASTSCRAIVPFSGPNTSVAIVDQECNVGTSTSGKGTYAPLSPIIELDEEPDGDDKAIKDYASHPNEINEPSQCLSLRLPDMLPEGKVHKLVYANEGESVMALSSNCTHKLWRWNKTCLNPSGKATSCESPVQLLPSDGLMINDMGVVDIEAHSFALTKDNKYLISSYIRRTGISFQCH